MAWAMPRGTTWILKCVEATFEPELDYADVLGQEVAKRGMALAAAGELGLLMIGSPGSGKTMLARRMTGILPELSVEDQQEALCIHSVLGENIDGLLAGHRPFRSPASQYFDRRSYRRWAPGAPG